MGYIGRFVIVVYGSFNPGILHPDWFTKHSLLPSEEYAGLSQEPRRIEIPQLGTLEYGQSFIVEPTRAILNFKSFAFSVERTKLELFCEDKDQFDLALKFIVKFFKLLPYTPVTKFRIVFLEHIIAKEDYNLIINKFFLVNEEAGKHFSNGETAYGHKIITKVGDGLLRYTIEPSNRLASGLYSEFNYTYEISRSDAADAPETAEIFSSKLPKCFDEAKSFTQRTMLIFVGEVIDRIKTIRT